MKKKLLLIGGGGHCHSVLDSVLSMKIYDEVGIVDRRICSYLGVSVIGNDEDIPALIQKGWSEAFVSVGSVGNTQVRRRLYYMLKEYNLKIAKIIDPSAIIGRNVQIDEGVFIGKRSVINAGAIIGVNSIINTGAIIEHDCLVGDFSHICPGTVLCGHVQIGQNCHIGAGSVVKQLVKIGQNTLIGVGSVVVKNIPNNVKAYGNPCRVIE